MAYQFPNAFIWNKKRVGVNCVIDGDNINLRFGYEPTIKDEIKAMDGARWNPEFKIWTIKNTRRNYFQLDRLAGRNPYKRYDATPVPFESTRPLFVHQGHLARHGLTVRQCIWAAEMGTGKTLAAIEVMEHSGFHDWWYISPKTAISAIRLELRKWNSKVHPEFYTYDSLKSLLANWPSGQLPPKGVFFDESSRVKTPQSQRSQAALHLANAMRDAWGDSAYVILMSGSPAPKSPLDWWMQAEIACPGFLREGNIEKFRHRLAVIEKRENNITGGMYPHMVGWRDSSDKCYICGQPRDSDNHDDMMIQIEGEKGVYHHFKPGKNEVEYLYERLKGLVTVLFKKDCLDLPEKVYEIIELEPSQSMLNAMMMLTASADTTIQALTLTRELSDGFQYEQTPDGKEPCPLCHGKKEIVQHVAKEGTTDDQIQEALVTGEHAKDLFHQVMAKCLHCGGEGEVTRYKRSVEKVPSPKDDVILDKLDSHEDDGRLVIYAGFTGSIDRLCELVKKVGWEWIRVDSGSFKCSYGIGPISAEDMLIDFQEHQERYPKLVFIGHPGSAGMGLTLTASDEIVYYSNTFNGEERIQSEDRIHRPGCRGAKITDIFLLPTDRLVHANLVKKRDMQAMTLGAFKQALEDSQDMVRRN